MRKNIQDLTCTDMLNMQISGQDIVCAAASVLIINTMNAIERLYEIRHFVFSDEETAEWNFVASEGNPSQEAALLLESDDSRTQRNG